MPAKHEMLRATLEGEYLFQYPILELEQWRCSSCRRLQVPQSVSYAHPTVGDGNDCLCCACLVKMEDDR
uniref:Uncharacterized protein n=1 Tax=uncultured prokaryote TaxID=198431 RepID=A0A0H5Q5B5_9ZZZZ|nr:hypothetical protein [uncultured prokaryote]